jgi:Flp pilus assembly protein TadD
MRASPIVLLLLLGACASQGGSGVNTAPAGVDVAEAALRSGSPQVALRIDSEILTKDPNNVAALLNQGDVQTSQQLLHEAADSYTAALRIDRDSVRARIGLGRLRLATDPAEAERLFLEALQHDPRNAVALNDLGIARDLQGRHDEAQAAYRQAMGINPAMTGAKVNLALSLAMAGRPEDAAPMMRSLADTPSAPAKFRHDLAAVLAMGGQKKEAEHILAKDMSQTQVNQALAVFTAASEPAIAPVAATLTADPSPAPAPALEPASVRASAQPAAQAAQAAQAGGIAVQFSSGPTQAWAEAKWHTLQSRMPDLLGDRQPILERADLPGRELWRVRTGGFGSVSAAEAFCRSAKSKGAGCYIIRS